MKVTPLSGALGAEIEGADLRDPSDFDEIFSAFVEHSVVVLRDQKITPEDHIAFAERFGEINVNRFFKPLEGYPQIATVTKEKDQTQAIGEGWHTDHSYDEIPALGSILRALEIPPYGGDTIFVSMGAAYDGLSDPMKTFLGGLKAWHSSRHVFGVDHKDSEAQRSGRLANAEQAQQDALHPLVIAHPLSGRPGLYVNPVFTTRIDGLSESESEALLAFLYEHCRQAEFQCRLRWHPGDVAIWDNRATWHKAVNDYHGHRRHMHRITVEGVALAAAHGSAAGVLRQVLGSRHQIKRVHP